MALQTLPAAAMGFGTVKISGAGPLADSNLKALIEAAAATQQPDALISGLLDPRITGCNCRIVAATTFYWENNGTVADATKMPGAVDDEIIVPKNSKEALSRIRVFATGAYDLRVMLW
jgi:hypothetical protein